MREEEYLPFLEQELEEVKRMPENGFERDSGDGEYWLAYFEINGKEGFTEEESDFLAGLAEYLQDAQFISRDTVEQGLNLAKAIVCQPYE